MTLVKTVGICDTQPVTIEGLQSLLRDSSELRVIGSATSLFNGAELAHEKEPALMVIDKAFGLPAVIDWLANLRATGIRAVVWGVAMSEAEALRLMHSGAQGVIRKT